jgi:hypothetical protein
MRRTQAVDGECENVVATTVQPAARPALVPDSRIFKNDAILRRKPQQRGAPARYGAGCGLPSLTLSAVIIRSGTGMPPAASRTRASGSVALVTTVQRSFGNAAKQCQHPGQHRNALCIFDLERLDDVVFRLRIEVRPQRRHRLNAPASMGMLMAYAGSMPRISAHFVQLRSTDPIEEIRMPSMSNRMPLQRIRTGEEAMDKDILLF